MKAYIKSAIELIDSEVETLLAAQSIGIGEPGADPGSALAPQYYGVVDDEE